MAEHFFGRINRNWRLAKHMEAAIAGVEAFLCAAFTPSFVTPLHEQMIRDELSKSIR